MAADQVSLHHRHYMDAGLISPLEHGLFQSQNGLCLWPSGIHQSSNLIVTLEIFEQRVLV